MKETDLFPPVRNYLESHGYNVHAEVGNCDIVATKNNETIILEMKLQLSVKLICQAVIRQKVESTVYIVIPQKRISKRQDFKEIKHLLRRLELGLITVDTDNSLSPLLTLSFTHSLIRKEVTKENGSGSEKKCQHEVKIIILLEATEEK